MAKERLDVIVQERLGISRTEAQALIRAGKVFDSGGSRLDKPGSKVEADIILDIRGSKRYVSRGGEKLEAALDASAWDLYGEDALDVGASTGGFTDCLLQRGAARVIAVDVGYGQLAWKLRRDPRVTLLERCNIRFLQPEQLPFVPTFFTVDCSFISLRLVLPAVVRLVAPQARGIALIKPQFEAGPEHVSRGGVVRDPSVVAEVIQGLCAFAPTLGLHTISVVPSPLLGPAGNREFLLALQRKP